MTEEDVSDKLDKEEDKEKDKENREASDKNDSKKQKVQFPQYFQQKKQRGRGSNPDGTNLATPVLRGVVVCEYDGDRIWVEASGNMKKAVTELRYLNPTRLRTSSQVQK